MWPFGTGSDYSSESQIKAKPKLAPFLNDATTTAPSRTTKVIINATATTKTQQATTVFHGNSPVTSDGTTTQGIVSANDSTSTASQQVHFHNTEFIFILDTDNYINTKRDRNVWICNFNHYFFSDGFLNECF